MTITTCGLAWPRRTAGDEGGGGGTLLLLINVDIPHSFSSSSSTSSNTSLLAPSVVDRPICTCGVHASWSKTRISLSNDRSTHNLYLEAMKEAVAKATTVVCIGDGSMLPWLLAKAGLPSLTKVQGVGKMCEQVGQGRPSIPDKGTGCGEDV